MPDTGRRLRRAGHPPEWLVAGEGLRDKADCAVCGEPADDPCMVCGQPVCWLCNGSAETQAGRCRGCGAVTT